MKHDNVTSDEATRVRRKQEELKLRLDLEDSGRTTDNDVVVGLIAAVLTVVVILAFNL
jgi:hypothetical protein